MNFGQASYHATQWLPETAEMGRRFFNAIGFRTNSFFAPGDLVEFGISTERTWETLAAYEIDIFIDHDGD